MKNIKVESEVGELRPEYNRSDFGEFTRGAVSQVEFAERVALLLACIGEDDRIKFTHHSIGNYRANQQPAIGHTKSITAIRSRCVTGWILWRILKSR